MIVTFGYSRVSTGWHLRLAITQQSKKELIIDEKTYLSPPSILARFSEGQTSAYSLELFSFELYANSFEMSAIMFFLGQHPRLPSSTLPSPGRQHPSSPARVLPVSRPPLQIPLRPLASAVL